MKSGVPPGLLLNKRGVIEHKLAAWCLIHPAAGIVIPRLAKRAEGSRPHAGGLHTRSERGRIPCERSLAIFAGSG